MSLIDSKCKYIDFIRNSDDSIILNPYVKDRIGGEKLDTLPEGLIRYSPELKNYL